MYTDCTVQIETSHDKYRTNESIVFNRYGKQKTVRHRSVKGAFSFAEIRKRRTYLNLNSTRHSSTHPLHLIVHTILTTYRDGILLPFHHFICQILPPHHSSECSPFFIHRNKWHWHCPLQQCQQCCSRLALPRSARSDAPSFLSRTRTSSIQ